MECAYRNGEIIGYIVLYEEEDSGFTQNSSVSGDFNGGMTEITGLSRSTVYLVSVAAVNNAGIGKFSHTVRVKTLDSEYVLLYIYLRFFKNIFSGVFLSLGGSIIPNHGYVVISDISNTYYSNALLCHTNYAYHYYPDGDWFSPSNSTDIEGFYTSTSSYVLRLYRSNTGEQPINGIYHCTVRDDTFTYQTVYVGLYNSESGELVLDARCSSVY